MISNTDQAIEIPDHLFVLANEHVILNSADTWAVLADECHRQGLDPAEVLELVLRVQRDGR